MLQGADDYDFTPDTSSSLSSLFDSSPTDPNTTLIYTAPKQPKSELSQPHPKKDDEKATTAPSSVLCAHVTNLWKLVNNNYAHLGKYGFAIIGSETQNEIIVYKEKNNVIARVLICDSFELTVKKDGYMSFFDSVKQNWLINFTSEESSTSVIHHLIKLGARINRPVTSTKVNAEKADILDRIAKMGQSILPTSPVKTSKASDTESEDESNRTKPNSRINAQGASTTSSGSMVSFEAKPPVFVGGFDPLSLYFTENHTHNSEVRMNLSQISDKLNQLIQCVNTTSSPPQDDSVLKSKIKGLELKIENMARDLQQSELKYGRLKSEFDHHGNEQEDDLKKYKDEAQMLSELLEIKKSDIRTLNKELGVVKSEICDKKCELEAANSRVRELELQLGGDVKNNEVFVANLKESMNEMYGSIVDKFDPTHQYSHVEIQSIIARSIKGATLKLIQDYKKTHEND